jgi:hypothetical protein
MTNPYRSFIVPSEAMPLYAHHLDASKVAPWWCIGTGRNCRFSGAKERLLRTVLQLQAESRVTIVAIR